MRAAGVRVARTAASWVNDEPAPGGYNWAADDATYAGLAAHGIRWQPIVYFAPGWATATGQSTGTWLFCPGACGGGGLPLACNEPPDASHYRDFAAYAAALVARYALKSVEIWNEPDLRAYWCTPDPAAYGRMYEAAYNAIKAVSAGTKVLLGGLSYLGGWFPGPLMAANPGLKTDGISFHPLSYTPAGAVALTESLRRTFLAAGLRAPFYLTEWGWGGSSFLPSSQTASFIAQATALFNTLPYVAQADYFSWVENPSNPWYLSPDDIAAFSYPP